jgi:hypothetical protein
MRNPLEALALLLILEVRFEATLGMGRIAARNQPVSAGNREPLLPAMALPIRSQKSIRHLALLCRHRPQAAPIHLWNVRHRFIRKQ